MRREPARPAARRRLPGQRGFGAARPGASWRPGRVPAAGSWAIRPRYGCSAGERRVWVRPRGGVWGGWCGGGRLGACAHPQRGGGGRIPVSCPPCLEEGTVPLRPPRRRFAFSPVPGPARLCPSCLPVPFPGGREHGETPQPRAEQPASFPQAHAPTQHASCG